MRHLTLVLWAISALLFLLGVDASPASPRQALRGRGRCRPSTSLLSTAVATTSSSISETPTSSETSTSTTTDAATETETSSEILTTISVTSSAPEIPAPTSTTSAAASDATTTSAPATSTEATSSSSTAESPATTSTAPPDPNLLANGGFEDAGGWYVALPVVGPQYSYDFNDTRAPHSGRASASVNWASRVPMGTVTFQFNQLITLIPNEPYAFSAWTRASADSTSPPLFCTLTYAIYTPDGSGAYAPLLASLTQLTPTWVQSNLTWTNRGYTAVRFNIQARCSAGLTPAGGFSIFFDDVSFEPL